MAAEVSQTYRFPLIFPSEKLYSENDRYRSIQQYSYTPQRACGVVTSTQLSKTSMYRYKSYLPFYTTYLPMYKHHIEVLMCKLHDIVGALLNLKILILMFFWVINRLLGSNNKTKDLFRLTDPLDGLGSLGYKKTKQSFMKYTGHPMAFYMHHPVTMFYNVYVLTIYNTTTFHNDVASACSPSPFLFFLSSISNMVLVMTSKNWEPDMKNSVYSKS